MFLEKATIIKNSENHIVYNGKNYDNRVCWLLRDLMADANRLTADIVINNHIIPDAELSITENNGWVSAAVHKQFNFGELVTVGTLKIQIHQRGGDAILESTTTNIGIPLRSCDISVDFYVKIGSIFPFNELNCYIPESFFTILNSKNIPAKALDSYTEAVSADDSGDDEPGTAVDDPESGLYVVHYTRALTAPGVTLSGSDAGTTSISPELDDSGRASQDETEYTITVDSLPSPLTGAFIDEESSKGIVVIDTSDSTRSLRSLRSLKSSTRSLKSLKFKLAEDITDGVTVALKYTTTPGYYLDSSSAWKVSDLVVGYQYSSSAETLNLFRSGNSPAGQGVGKSIFVENTLAHFEDSFGATVSDQFSLYHVNTDRGETVTVKYSDIDFDDVNVKDGDLIYLVLDGTNEDHTWHPNTNGVDDHYEGSAGRSSYKELFSNTVSGDASGSMSIKDLISCKPPANTCMTTFMFQCTNNCMRTDKAVNCPNLIFKNTEDAAKYPTRPTGMFAQCGFTEIGDLWFENAFDYATLGADASSGLFDNSPRLKKVGRIYLGKNVTKSAGATHANNYGNKMFNACTNLETIGCLPHLQYCTDVTSMFAGCTKLSSVKFRSLPESSDLTLDLSMCPLDADSLASMIIVSRADEANATNEVADEANATNEVNDGSCTIKFSEATKALSNYAAVTARLIEKGYTII